MKIVHIITRLIIGGAQENTLLSCEGQHDRGHDVTLIAGPAVGPEGSLEERAKSFGYRVELMPELRRAIDPLRDWAVFHRLIDRIEAIGPDVVHTHSSKAGIIGRWAAWRARSNTAGGRARPFIVHTIHGLAFTASTRAAVNGVYRLLERRTAPITDRIVCVADSMRDQSLAAKIGRAEQYVTVYSGMETGQFIAPPVARESTRAALGIAEDQIIVGTIARLFELKGHDDLLDIAADLCGRFEKLRFLWVGDGALREKLQRRIEQMGLSQRFIFTGLVPPGRVPELTAAMDIVVHPSHREGLARALPQGALAGKPVVTYDIDGAKEAVVDGKTGYVVPPRDKRRLGEGLAALIGDSALRRMMGEAGRALALSRFDVRAMVDALDQVYAPALVHHQQEHSR
jgi:glycosyltransferase involved in cell wall biosynthesis